MNEVTAGLIVLPYIGYSLPFGGGSIKSCAYVLHNVSITVVKNIKVLSQFSSLFGA